MATISSGTNGALRFSGVDSIDNPSTAGIGGGTNGALSFSGVDSMDGEAGSNASVMG